MFFYLIYNSSIIKKDIEKNKNVNTLIYGSIVYIVLHGLILANKSLRENILRYFWIIISIDVVSMFLTTDMSTELQKHNLAQDTKYLIKKKKKRKEVVINPLEEEKIEERKPLKSTEIKKIKRKKAIENLEATQEILNQIEKDTLEIPVEEESVKEEEEIIKEEDIKSEISDSSDLELDLESFEKSLLND